MKKLLLLFFLCTFSAANAAEKALPFSYLFTAPTLAGQKQYADPGFQKLLPNAKAGSVIWRYRDNRKRPVIIKCHFLPGTQLSEVTIGYFRPHAVRKHSINYGIKNIKVFGISPEGKKIPIGGIVLNQPYAKPAGEPEQGIIRIVLEKKPIAGAELHFTGNNGRLALNALSFKGIAPAAAPPKKVLQNTPWQQEIDAAGNTLNCRRSGSNYILENPHVIYIINPDAGGSVVLAYDRSRKINLIRQGIAENDWGPFFQDRFYPGGGQARDAFRDTRFQTEKPEISGSRAVLRLRGRGKRGNFTGVLIEKKYLLEADSPVLKVEYAIHNMPENVVPLRNGYWSCGGVESANGYKMIIPGKTAVDEIGFFPGYREFPELSGNWYAAWTPEDNVLGCIMPGELLKSLCFWTSGTHRGTLECKFGIYNIKAGDALRFTAALVPFGGIGRPEALSAAAATGVNADRIDLRFFTPGKYLLEFNTAVLSQKLPRWKKAGSHRLDISGSSRSVSLPLPKGKYDAVQAVLIQNGQKVLLLEKGFNGKRFPLTPAAVKRKESSAGDAGGLKLNFNSTAVKSPHWKWAVPLAGKVPSILGICYKAGGIRDMAELALRCGIKFDTHYISGRWTLTDHQDLSEAQCVKELERTLKKNYDAIMISGNVWKKFTPSLKNIILQKVKAGSGLLLIAPEGLPAELAGFVAPVPREKTVSKAVWKNMTVAPTVSGIPFEALPPTAVTPYNIKGTTLVKAGKWPLLSEFLFGKGKVFVFTWPAADNKSKLSRGSFFLPKMENISPLPEWAYHEYQIALLARTVCEAARRATPLRSGTFRWEGKNKLCLTLDAEKAVTVKADLRIRDRFSALSGTLSKEFRLKAGKNDLLFELPALPAMTGRFFVNVRVGTGKGILWWGAASGENQGPSKIIALKIPRTVMQANSVLKGEVRVQGKGTVQISAFDNQGNCFAQSTGKSFAFPLETCTTPSGKIRAELIVNGKVTDRKEKRFDLFFTPDPLNFNVAFGWPSVSIRAHVFNNRTFMEQMARFGLTCLNGDRYSLDLPAVESALRDFGWPQFSTQTHGFLGTKKPYNRYLVPKHKFELVRTPCLSSPAFRKRLAAESAALYPNYRLGALMVAGPDESNMFAQWDGCFTPDCREKFRAWLKKEYKTLEALNRSWHTDFKDWNDVTAMTLAEIRKRNSFAPWLDHRTFNDWNRADALKELAQGIRKTASLGYSFSGTQETNPFNAWDWYQMMPLLGGVSSYYGEQTIQHRSFATGKFYQMPWIGYDSTFQKMDRQLWIALMNGATGVNLYGCSFYIQPDFTLSRTADDLIRVVRRWNSGAAQTLQSASLPDSEIALHYTPASLKVNEVLEVTALRHSAVAGIKLLLNEKNLSYRYLAYGEIEKNQFRNTKLLFLPLSSALSPGEVKNITAFVEQGGIVIADMLTGTYDNHGTPSGSKTLRDLFGIRTPGEFVRQSGTARLSGRATRILCYEKGIVPAPGVRVLGKNPDGSPAALVNRRGRGMTIYLGNSLLSAMGDLQEVRYSEANTPIRKALLELLSTALNSAGIRAAFRIPDLQSAEVLIRDLGKIRFAGVGRNDEETGNSGLKEERKTVFLDREYHIYDLFKRKYLGCGKSFDFVFAPAGQEIFALLPYRITGLSAAATRAKNCFLVDAAVCGITGTPQQHTLRFELYDPSGKVRSEYSAWLRTAAGKARWKWHIPYNAPEGRWHLAVTETISGIRKVIELPVP